MFNLKDIPPELQESARLLARQVKEKQDKCPHEFQKIMVRDPNYCPGLNRPSIVWEVIKEFHCPLCNLSKTFNEIPWKVCHKCGGQMKSDGTTHYGEDRVYIHKCTDCGHEYATT